MLRLQSPGALLLPAALRSPRAPTTAGRGPQVQKPLAQPELEAGQRLSTLEGSPTSRPSRGGASKPKSASRARASCPSVLERRHVHLHLQCCGNFAFLQFKISTSICFMLINISICFPGGLDGEEAACNAGDLGLIPGSERFAGERERLPTPVFLPAKIPWTEEAGRIQSMGSQRVGHD